MVLAAAGLSIRARANYQLIRGGVTRGLSKRAINDLIKARDGRGLRSDFLGKAVNYAKGQRETGVYLRNVGLDRMPNPSRLTTSKAHMTTRFRYEVRLRGINRLTGQVQDGYITVRTDRPLTRRGIEEEARKWSELGNRERYGVSELGELEFELESGAFNSDIPALTSG